MPQYLITNRVPTEFRSSPNAFAAWTAWFERLGPHLQDRGNPAFAHASLGNCGPETVLGGYTLISADNLAAAVDLAKSHPLMSLGGGLELGELTRINAGKELSADYEKALHVKASADAVFEALTTLRGLSGWWTQVQGSEEQGGELQFHFSDPNPLVISVDRAERPSSVVWTVRACNFLSDWVGTSPTFTIAPDDAGGCEVHFRHRGLTPQLECFAECRQGWDHHLRSLRDYVEIGQGSPFTLSNR